MTHGEFKDKWLDKSIDWDGFHGPQCVDAVRQYIDDVLQAEQPEGTGSVGAKGFVELYGKPERRRHNKWTVHTKPSSFAIRRPEQGAIAVFGAVSGNPFGHVGIVDSASVNGVTLLEQDGFEKKPVLKIAHWKYDSLIGWLTWG